MKIVIDIPDYDLKQIKKYYEESEILESVYSYIYHGQPLAEILNKISAEINTPNRGTCDYFIVDRIEEIISEYREGDSE